MSLHDPHPHPGATGPSAGPQEPPSPFVGKEIGSYRLIKRIGKGGFGEVLLAVHLRSEAQRAAVKVLYPHLTDDAKLVRKFFDEARAVGLVNHPGLIKIFDFGTLPDGTVFLLMELLQGETLWARMARLHEEGARLPLSDSLRLARQAASALAAVHEQGIFHRDIKPENLFIVSDPESAGGERAKLLDFGIAKFRDATNQTQTSQPIGTAWYMSPEQWRAEQIDGKADVYSLGILLFEMIAGKPPFDANAYHAIMMRHLLHAPPPLRDLAPAVPGAVHDLVHQMIDKDAAQRPTMSEVLVRLKELDRSLTGQNPRVNTPPRDSGLSGAPTAPGTAPMSGWAESVDVESPPLLLRRLRIGGGAAVCALAVLWLATAGPKPEPRQAPLDTAKAEVRQPKAPQAPGAATWDLAPPTVTPPSTHQEPAPQVEPPKPTNKPPKPVRPVRPRPRSEAPPVQEETVVQ